MATLATGNTTGGQKKSSGVSLGSSLKETWAKVRDDSDESCSWVLAGFSPGSKTNIEAIASGAGGLDGATAELKLPVYDAQCVYGGAKDQDGKFVHLTYVGASVGALARGRASMAKNAVLNEFEGCVREVNIIQGETEEGSAAQFSPAAPPAAPAVASSALPTAAPAASSPPAVNVAVSSEAVSTAAAVDGGTALERYKALSDAEFESVFGSKREVFEALPAWKQTQAKKKHGYF